MKNYCSKYFQNLPKSHLILGVFAILGVFWLSWDLRPIPIDGRVDDWKYVQDALFIEKLEWLGPYNERTLIKRPFFSLVIAATSMFHVPWTVFQFSFLIFSVFVFASGLKKLGHSFGITAAIFYAVLFLPTFFDRESVRMTRDIFFICWQLVMLGLIFRLMAIPFDWQSQAWKKLLTWTYVAIAFHAGLREEAFVFWPCLIVLLIYYFSVQKLSIKQKLKFGTMLLLGGILSVQLSLFSVRTLNYFYYGVFILNEHEEGYFPQAMAAISSIDSGQKNSHLLIDYQERQQLRQLSPKFHQISRILDIAGETVTPGCVKQENCEGNDYSHAIFFLRTNGLPEAGVNTDARKAQTFYAQLRDEIIAACNNNKIKCENPIRTSMTPPFRRYHVPYFIAALKTHLYYHFMLQNRGFSPYAHEIGQNVINDFEEATKQKYYMIWPDGKVTGTLPASLDVINYKTNVRATVGRWYSALAPTLVIAGLIAFLIRIMMSLWIGFDITCAIILALLDRKSVV